MGFPADCRAARGGACGGGRRRRKVGFADRESLSTVVGRVFQENSDNEIVIGTVTLGLKNLMKQGGWNDTQP